MSINVDIYPATRTIYLGCDIDPDATAELVRGLLEFEISDPKAPATILINSLGGDTVQGLAMHDLIRNAPFPITGIVVGECYSAAVMVFQACSVRKMLPNARMMIHEGTMSVPKVYYHEGLKMVEEVVRITERMYEILGGISGKTKKELSKLMKDSTFFSASEAIEQGFCDRVHVAL